MPSPWEPVSIGELPLIFGPRISLSMLQTPIMMAILPAVILMIKESFWPMIYLAFMYALALLTEIVPRATSAAMLLTFFAPHGAMRPQEMHIGGPTPPGIILPYKGNSFPNTYRKN